MKKNKLYLNRLLTLCLLFFGAAHAQVAPNVSAVTGATVDESGISNVIYVRQSGGNNSNGGKSYSAAKQTIQAAFTLALTDLDAGIKTKILIYPGTYREALGDIDFSTNNNRKTTPLVIEGTDEAQVIWTGADSYAPGTWTSLGNGLYRHSWTKDMGNYTPTFGPQAEVSVRKEMIVLNGDMMRQIPLERYTIEGGGNFFGSITPVTYTYTGFDAPSTSLTDYSFGVAEKTENGNYIYLKVPSGFNWSAANIEVATRYTLARFKSKNGMVFRKITFKNCANDHNDFGHVGALRFGEANKNDNIKFENCTFTQNSSNGLKPAGKHWTLRNCKFTYNGNSGINSGVEENFLIENCEFNFNNWRGYAFGDPKGGISWYLAGAKIQGCDGVILRNVKAIGNHCNGLWYDIHVKNVLTDGLISLYNRNALSIELSNGPYLVNRSILAYQTDNALNYSVLGDVNLTNSILISNSTKTGNNGRDGAALGIQWYNRTDEHANQELVLGKPFVTENNIIVKENSPSKAFTVFQDIWPAGNKTDNYSYKGINNVYYGVSQTAAFHSSGHGFNPGGDGDLAWWKTVWKVASDNSTWQNPQIVNAPNGDFTLGSTSPVKSKEDYFMKYKLPQSLATKIGDYFTWTTWGTKTGAIPSGYSGNIAPMVAIDYESLHDGQVVESNAGVVIKASATDDDGTISKVEFYNGSTYLGVDNTAPYQFTWNSPPVGQATVTAKATDNSNATSKHTVSVNIVANVLPTVSITSPNNNAGVNESSSVTFTADAADGGSGNVTKVEFYADDLLLGQDNSSPYSYQWSGTTARRNIKITAKVYDNSGAVVTSSPIYIHSKAVIASGDTFSIVSENGGGTQALNALSTSVNAGVNKVENTCDNLMRWVFEDAGSGNWYLKNKESGYYLFANGTADPSNISLKPKNTSDNLCKWTVSYYGNGWFHLTNVGNSLRLDGDFGGVSTSSVSTAYARSHWELKRNCGTVSNTTVELSPLADAYVRAGTNGSSTYHDDNYGSSDVLTVRYHNSYHQYQSFLKFDLSSISGDIISAKLQLVPVTIGGASTHTLKYNSDASWGESTITWDNSRSLITGTTVSTWNANTLALNTVKEIDVTSTLANYTNSAITFSLQGSANVTETKFGSKENSTSAYRPKLVVEYASSGNMMAGKSSKGEIASNLITENTTNGLQIAPNPASDYIEIHSPEKVRSIAISDVNGKVLISKKYAGDVKNARIDVSDLPAGLYLVTTKTDTGIITKKLLVDKR